MIYNLDIPKLFNIKENNNLYYNLYEIFRGFGNDFKKEENEPWTSLTFILDDSGNLKLEFSYEPLSTESAIEDQEKWGKKYIRCNKN